MRTRSESWNKMYLFHTWFHKRKNVRLDLLTKCCLALVYLFTCLLSLANGHGTSILKDPKVSSLEPVFYDQHEVLWKHGRHKRNILSANQPFNFWVNSTNRNFSLRLKKDKSIFHDNVIFENSLGPVDYDVHRVVAGRLEDNPESTAQGVITEHGHFDGHVHSNGESFYIEPSKRYAASNVFASQGIMYKGSTTKVPKGNCASQELYKNMSNGDPARNTSSVEEDRVVDEVMELAYENRYVNSHNGKHRSKRWAISPEKKTCLLYLQADHLFYSHMGSETAAIDMMVRHIQRVNEIYSATDFDMDGKPDGVNFMIKRIKVHTHNDSTHSDYKYNGRYEVIKFLELFSEGDYDDYCLAYMFTFRDFEGGTLGLAWTGDLSNAGGVCERKGHFRGGLKSLNTGIITLLNYGKVVLPAVSFVTLAHEIGHNFGSPHDPEDDRRCTPGGAHGNYIMYARATAGDQRNNNRFSPCSLRSILPVLNYKARELHGCFTETKVAICGNREVEEDEECDCGWEEDCNESCCFPMTSNPKKGETPCTLKPKKVCSPSQGPCCHFNCTLMSGEKCRDDNGCRDRAFCDGAQPTCPASNHKPNKTVCQDGASVCFMGECTGSICLAYGLESCQCTPNVWESKRKLCELCCQVPGEIDTCRSSFEWNIHPYDVPDLYAKPGSPCKNYTGYCDSYHNCREVDPTGPLSTLRNLLLADEGLSAIADWIDNHWHAFISFIALLIVMIVLTAKLCGKRAKAKLRKITVMHSNLEAIEVQRTYWDENGEHVVHPTAIRKKIPIRKKVREKKKSKRGSPTKSKDQNGNFSNKTYFKLKRKQQFRKDGDAACMEARGSSNIELTPQGNSSSLTPDVATTSNPESSGMPLTTHPTRSAVDQSCRSNDVNKAGGGLKCSTVEAGSSSSTHCDNFAINHHKAVIALASNSTFNHEAKTAILPSVPSKGKKRYERKSKHCHQSSKQLKSTKSRTGRRKSEKVSSGRRRKSSKPNVPGNCKIIPKNEGSEGAKDSRKNDGSKPSTSEKRNFSLFSKSPEPTGNRGLKSSNLSLKSSSTAWPCRIRSSGSLLSRGMRRKSKPELRVLIPDGKRKITTDDDDLTSPVTS